MNWGIAAIFVAAVVVTLLIYQQQNALALDAVGSVPNNNGASLASNHLRLQPADATHPGVVTTADQTVAGVKAFQDGVDFPNTLNVVASYDGSPLVSVSHDSIAVGDGATLTGTSANSLALGFGATVNGDNAIALGNGATAAANNRLAIGNAAFATANTSVSAATASTHKLEVYIGGTKYYLLMSNV